MTKDWKKVGSQLERVGKGTSKFLDKYNEISERSNMKESSVLFGTTGGIVGSLIGIFLAPMAGVPLLLLSVPTTGLGITFGLLGYRGSTTFRIERRLAHKRMISDGILKDIKALPDDAPETVRQSMWLKYEKSVCSTDESETLWLPAPKKADAPLGLPDKSAEKDT